MHLVNSIDESFFSILKSVEPILDNTREYTGLYEPTYRSFTYESRIASKCFSARSWRQ
jgi:hypothetical protein